MGSGPAQGSIMKVQDLLTLDGKNALVTGGSRGLGLQMAEALGEMGATVATPPARRTSCDDAVSRLASRSIRSLAFVCDVGKREQIAPLVDAVLQALGRVDILVNNAGTTWGAPAEDHPVEAWDKLVSVNLTAAFLLSQQVAKRSMIPARWGRIINTASVAGLSASDPRSCARFAYNATKHGLGRPDAPARRRIGGARVTVNAICPGFLPVQDDRATLDVAARWCWKDPDEESWQRRGPQGARGALASEASRHIPGQAIAVDAGDADLASGPGAARRARRAAPTQVAIEHLGLEARGGIPFDGGRLGDEGHGLRHHRGLAQDAAVSQARGGHESRSRPGRGQRGAVQPGHVGIVAIVEKEQWRLHRLRHGEHAQVRPADAQALLHAGAHAVHHVRRDAEPPAEPPGPSLGIRGRGDENGAPRRKAVAKREGGRRAAQGVGDDGVDMPGGVGHRAQGAGKVHEGAAAPARASVSRSVEDHDREAALHQRLHERAELSPHPTPAVRQHDPGPGAPAPRGHDGVPHSHIAPAAGGQERLDPAEGRGRGGVKNVVPRRPP